MKKWMILIDNFLFWISSHLRCRLIEIDDKPYLERYHLMTIFGVTFYLHRFVGSDGDRNVHDHPFHAMAFVLNGQYTENILKHLCCKEGLILKRRIVRFFNFIPATKFHIITFAKPLTWTLFIHMPRHKTWGFLYPGKHYANIHTSVTYHQPFDIDATIHWTKRAKKGKDTPDRMPKGYRHDECCQ